MERHTAELIVKIYSVVFWIFTVAYAVAALGMLFGASLLSAVGGGMIGMGEMDAGMMGGLIGALGVVIGILLLGLAVLSGFVAHGLWKRRPWARIAGLVLSILWLLSFPIGTIVGAFGIYFFGFEDDVKALFSDSATRASPAKRTVKRKARRS